MPDMRDVKQNVINVLGLRPVQRELTVRRGIRLGLVTKEEVEQARREAGGQKR